VKAGSGLELQTVNGSAVLCGWSAVFHLSGRPDPVFCPVPLLVEVIAGGGCLGAAGGGLLLQTGGLGRFDVGFGLGGAGLGAVSSASVSRCLILSVSSAASPRMLWALLWR